MTLGAPLAVGRTAEIYAWGEGRVLKLFRDGWGKDSAAHELAAARAIHAAGVSSPRADEAVEVAGRAGILYEHISGPTLLDVLLARP
jgi:hypothetical protein